MVRFQLPIFLVFAASLSGSCGCFDLARTGKTKEPTVYALVWLGDPIRFSPYREGKDRAEVFQFRASEFRDEENVLQPALEDPAVANFLGFWRGKRWLKNTLRVELLDEPEVLRPVLAGKQGIVRVSLVDGSAEEQAAFINAVVRAWDKAFFARGRGKALEVQLKKMQERAMKSVRYLEARLARLNQEPIPDDPVMRESLEGRKRVVAENIRWEQEAIRNIPKRIERVREAQLRLPVVLEWARAP